MPRVKKLSSDILQERSHDEALAVYAHTKVSLMYAAVSADSTALAMIQISSSYDPDRL